MSESVVLALFILAYIIAPIVIGACLLRGVVRITYRNWRGKHD